MHGHMNLKSDEEVWTTYICFRIGTSGGQFEWGNNPMGTIKWGEIHDGGYISLSSRALCHGVTNSAHEIILDVSVNRDAFSVLHNVQ